MSNEGGAGRRWSWSVEAAGGKLKYLVDLFARDVELFDDFVDRGAGFEVFEYSGNGHTRIAKFWDDILRFIATIKLKETTASDIFCRLNSYSKQHGLYHALKAFGQILRSIFILRLIDEPVLRMSIEKVPRGIFSANRSLSPPCLRPCG